jgi:transposase
MDRESLEKLLVQGLSLAEIGRRFGRHESTISYWVRKHRLHAAHRDAHAARGPITRRELASLVNAGMSISEIANHVERSKATVRYWLRCHELKTHAHDRRFGSASTSAAKAAGRATIIRECQRHGLTEFWLEGRGYYRCKRCRMERVVRRRRKLKALLVAEAGGHCFNCGYDRCVAALHFHHVDRNTKLFNLSMQGVTRSLARAKAEAEKCVLLCANCHAEVESGVARLSPEVPRRDVA